MLISTEHEFLLCSGRLVAIK